MNTAGVTTYEIIENHSVKMIGNDLIEKQSLL